VSGAVKAYGIEYWEALAGFCEDAFAFLFGQGDVGFVFEAVYDFTLVVVAHQSFKYHSGAGLGVLESGVGGVLVEWIRGYFEHLYFYWRSEE